MPLCFFSVADCFNFACLSFVFPLPTDYKTDVVVFTNRSFLGS